MSDLSCLSRWKDKWFNSEPLVVEQRAGRSFKCPECLPSCNYIKYNIQSSWGYFNPTNILKTQIIDNVYKSGNLSMVHVFFGRSFIKEYQQTILSTSLDLLSVLGGIFSLMLGISLTSAVELIFYLTGKLFTVFTRLNKNYPTNIEKEVGNNLRIINVTSSTSEEALEPGNIEDGNQDENHTENLSQIYWNEIAALSKPARRRLF